MSAGEQGEGSPKGSPCSDAARAALRMGALNTQRDHGYVTTMAY